MFSSQLKFNRIIFPQALPPEGVIMKNKFIIVSVLLTTSQVFAGSLNLELRGDLTSTSYNAAATSATSKNNYIFNLQTLKLDGKGNINETTSYRLKFILNKPSVKETKRESANDWVEMAYLNNKLSDQFAITAGKFNSEIGGWEGNIPRIDLYMVSGGFSQINGLRYHTGLKFAYNCDEDNTISLQVANQEADSNVGGTTATPGSQIDQNRSVYGAVYKGKLFEKSLLPILSYFVSPLSTGNFNNPGSSGNVAATTDSAKNTYTNAGLRYLKDSWQVDLDYGLITKKELNSITTDEDWTNMVVKVGYKVQTLTPALKWFSTDQNLKTVGSADAKTKWDGTEISLDYMPIAEQNLRYHLAYNIVNKKPATADTQTTTQIFAGLSMYADILK